MCSTHVLFKKVVILADGIEVVLPPSANPSDQRPLPGHCGEIVMRLAE